MLTTNWSADIVVFGGPCNRSFHDRTDFAIGITAECVRAPVKDVNRLAELARPPAVWELPSGVRPIAEVVGIERHALAPSFESVVVAERLAQ
jgi:hypothetical protein